MEDKVLKTVVDSIKYSLKRYTSKTIANYEGYCRIYRTNTYW